MVRTFIVAVLSCTAMLVGCAGDTASIDTINQGPAQVEQTGATEPVKMETTASMDYGEEMVGEATEYLTNWQQVCIVGCQVFANAGCTSVSLSCTAGAVWSFGGVLIPCVYAVLAACAGATAAGTVCTFKCSGG